MDTDDTEGVPATMGSCFMHFDFEAAECKRCLLSKACKTQTMDKELHEILNAEGSMHKMPQ